ncbi:MAG: signal peptide peptidase SppA [Candidatus Marinimicrobia bacterium]|nr:signal peptide peptidase SppA [Candidatus Neomarinimicrobiota bacterium]
MTRLSITIVCFFLFLNCGTKKQYPKVGLVEINGTIIESEEIIKNLNYFYLRDDIEGILVRVNSPGGGVAPSQEIYEKIKNIRENSSKPIVVSMSSIATSGGYYVSIGADSIIANPGSITGSIGVIMGYPTINKLMDLIGINYTTIKSGKYKDSGSPFRESQNTDNQYFKDVVNELYSQFKEDVSSERNLSEFEINEIAQGQIFSGRQAFKLGLVDRLGTFEDAIWLIGRMAGFNSRPSLVRIPEKRLSLIDAIIGEIKVNLGTDYMFGLPEYKYK